MERNKEDKLIETSQQFNFDSAEMEVLLFEEERQLHEAIIQLDEKYRIPLILYYFQDLSYQQIADVQNISMSAVKTRLYRAKDALKKVMQENGGAGYGK
jgi:RNA polymerase sigma-70 factor (ECF subfamily)